MARVVARGRGNSKGLVHLLVLIEIGLSVDGVVPRCGVYQIVC